MNVRRVVTGHAADGTAKILIDADAEALSRGKSGSVYATLWSTDATPANIPIGDSIDDPAVRAGASLIAPGGTRFNLLEYAPGNTGVMHRTETLDYIVVVSGSIDMLVDGGSSVSLNAGDVVIQRGTNHVWTNRGTVPARVACVLIDAIPLGIGRPRS
jgi:quercetin dioxygenase-like cupin family protein